MGTARAEVRLARQRDRRGPLAEHLQERYPRGDGIEVDPLLDPGGDDLSDDVRIQLAVGGHKNPPLVVADAKSIEVYDFLEAHKPRRTYIPFDKAGDLRGAVVVVDKFWTRPGQWWSQPRIEPQASWSKLHESERIAVYRVVR